MACGNSTMKRWENKKKKGKLNIFDSIFDTMK